MIPDLREENGESRVWAILKRLAGSIAETIDTDTPLIFAGTVGEIEYVERAVLENQPDRSRFSSPAVLVGKLMELLGLRGKTMAMSSACASSSAALTRAASMVRNGLAQQVLVVAADAVSEFVYSGFSSLLSLSAGPARPFDRDRCGLTLGEAAGYALVTAGGVGTEIVGWGSTTDAIHMTAPDRNARGLIRAIEKATAMAGISATDIGLIAAHGTATVYSDAMEMTAFRATMSAARPVFSIKGAIGHTLAAAGLTQILVARRALEEGIAPPTVGCEIADELATGWASSSAVPLGNSKIALSTNSGFGGVNTAVVLAKGGQQ
jgi:3-oxoacyl-[acyl-carrier-protein] synthase II